MEPKFDHPEITLLEDSKYKALMGELFVELTANERKQVNLTITADKLKELKRDVYAMQKDGELSEMKHEQMPSTNDCIVALIFRTYAESGVDLSGNPGNILPLQLACNTRFRREPKVPVTYFGNMALNAETYWTLDELKQKSLFEIASALRQKLLGINQEFVQSTIDKITQSKDCKYASILFPTRFTVTNWNNPNFDWYGLSDLGSGGPETFNVLSKYMDQMCVVTPAKEPGSLKLLIGAKVEIMEKFIKDENILKYFTF